MSTSKVVYKENLRTQLTHLKSGEVVLNDAPTDNSGKGEAFSPTDLLATSLASCMLTIMGIRANDNKWNLGNPAATVTKVMESNPRRVSEIQIEIKFDISFNDQQKRILEHAAKNCPVAKSLHPDIQQHVHFIYA